MRRKKVLYISIIIVFCAFLVFICYAAFYFALDGFHKIVNTAGEIQVRAVDKEISFLADLQNKVDNLENCNLLKDEITARLTRLNKEKSNVLAESNIQKFAKVLSAPEHEYGSLRKQIQFLIEFEKKLDRCKDAPIYASLKKDISEKIVSLRMRLSYIEAVGTKDSVSRLSGEVPEYFYVPNYSIEPLKVTWDNGGEAVIYKVEKMFPAKEVLDDFSRYYANLGWKPLEYDVCQALELAGLKGGWRKGPCDTYFWTQFWLSEVGDVINVNVSYYDHNEANVVVTYSRNELVQPALDYYYTIHGVSEGKLTDEMLKTVLEQGYRFCSVRSY